jgi:chromosomal replication initiator protein
MSLIKDLCETNDYPGMSLKAIGGYFGGRDHSTVIHGLEAVSDLVDTEKKMKIIVNELRKTVGLKPL